MENPSAPLPTLPMHLMLTLGCYLSSPFAWQCASAGLLPLSPAAKSKAPSPAEQEKLKKAIHAEAGKRAREFLGGILRYYDAPYQRDVAEPPAIWKRGNARLLDYGQLAKPAPDAPVVLFVPSLINRYYILDLSEERSMMRYLAARGLYPLVLDWDAPGEFEKSFDCGDYITEILTPAIDFLHRTTGRKIVLAGYCMGGVLALAAAQLARAKVASIALLATPWDFHCQRFAPFVVQEKWQEVLGGWIKSRGDLPADIIQSLFYWTDPWLFEHKFTRFGGLASTSEAVHEFVALEHWVNDGVPMTAPAATESLIGWAQKNQLARGEWTVSSQKIIPAKLKLPAFIAMPQNDHVVPRDCAQPLADAMPRAKAITPSSGHVGMIVGHRAQKELWEPLVKWTLSVAG